jgi:hypothetical protein
LTHQYLLMMSCACSTICTAPSLSYWRPNGIEMPRTIRYNSYGGTGTDNSPHPAAGRKGRKHMSQRLRKAQQQHILSEMIALARFLTVKGVPLPKVYEAVKQLKTDLVQAYRQGITSVSVERSSHLERDTGTRQEGEHQCN